MSARTEVRESSQPEGCLAKMPDWFFRVIGPLIERIDKLVKEKNPELGLWTSVYELKDLIMDQESQTQAVLSDEKIVAIFKDIRTIPGYNSIEALYISPKSGYILESTGVKFTPILEADLLLTEIEDEQVLSFVKLKHLFMRYS